MEIGLIILGIMGVINYYILFNIFTKAIDKKDKIKGFLILILVNLFFSGVVYFVNKVVYGELFLIILLSYLLIAIVLIILSFVFVYIVEPFIVIFGKGKKDENYEN